jgi:hypothetical protein
MPERPLLLFPEPIRVGRSQRNGGQSRVSFPSHQRQVNRIGPRIDSIETMFRNRSIELRDDPTGAEPEDVLVLETVGTVAEFSRAVSRIDGMAWMIDIDVQDIPQDTDFFVQDRPAQTLSGCLYLIMSNQTGIAELQRLWRTFRSDQDHPIFEWGQAKWRDMFNKLKDIRPWGPEDRLRESGLLEEWRERVQAGEEELPLEIELWFRSSATERQRAAGTVQTRVEELGGRVITSAVVEEIRYHAVLARLPIQGIGDIQHLPQTRLVQSREIMFLRPVGQFAVVTPEGEPIRGPDPPQSIPDAERAPVVALLDGFPLENHRWLNGRVEVDDPDGWSASCPAQERVHGTAMASLIIHGELDSPGQPLPGKLYVRPIMRPDPTDFRDSNARVEPMPEDILPVDLIHRSVVRMFEREGSEPPAAPNIKIINLSIGDRCRQFDRYPSP